MEEETNRRLVPLVLIQYDCVGLQPAEEVQVPGCPHVPCSVQYSLNVASSLCPVKSLIKVIALCSSPIRSPHFHPAHLSSKNGSRIRCPPLARHGISGGGLSSVGRGGEMTGACPTLGWGVRTYMRLPHRVRTLREAFLRYATYL